MNLSVDGNTVQVPVSVAANVCDIAVDVLSADLWAAGETVCEIDQQTAATNDIAGYEDTPGQGGGNHNGLVNVSVDGNTVQVPIGVASTCKASPVNVLARDFTGSDSTACEIDQETAAANNFPSSSTEPKGLTPPSTGLQARSRTLLAKKYPTPLMKRRMRPRMRDTAQKKEDAADEAEDAADRRSEYGCREDTAEDAAGEAAGETADEASDAADWWLINKPHQDEG